MGLSKQFIQTRTITVKPKWHTYDHHSYKDKFLKLRNAILKPNVHKILLIGTNLSKTKTMLFHSFVQHNSTILKISDSLLAESLCGTLMENNQRFHICRWHAFYSCTFWSTYTTIQNLTLIYLTTFSVINNLLKIPTRTFLQNFIRNQSISLRLFRSHHKM